MRSAGKHPAWLDLQGGLVAAAAQRRVDLQRTEACHVEEPPVEVGADGGWETPHEGRQYQRVPRVRQRRVLVRGRIVCVSDWVTC